MSLQEEINKTRQEIKTDHYSMSIGEWISLYENSEIDVHPEFQRFFRWSDEQKSALIESILLGIPIPPIFVSQRDDGVWDVIDGLQRLSTIYEFVGILKSSESKEPFELKKTLYLPSLAGKKWNDPHDSENSLTQSERLLIKRARIDANIIAKESDDLIKYELFQRLNTGGSIATSQEVRNCILLMMNSSLYDSMRALASRESFKHYISLSDRLYEEQYDMELVLRFILLFEKDKDKLQDLARLDVRDFLTSGMREIAARQNLDLTHIEHAFDTTFNLLSEVAPTFNFKRYKKETDSFIGGFLLSLYEVVALGIGYNYKRLPPKDEILQRIKAIYSDPIYKKWSGAGVNAGRRLPYLIQLGRDLFSPS
jgi:hypothetical protein